MSWDEFELGELVEIRHGYAFRSTFFADSGKYILLTPGNCHPNGGLKLKGDKEKYYSAEPPEEFILSNDDLVVVMTDLVQSAPILGGAFLVPEDDKFLHNQRLGLVHIKNPIEVDKKYIYYLLNTPNYRAQVRGSASGATVRHTSPSRIYSCKVRLPDRTRQLRVASILSAYDDLIENNRRRIQLLEEAARLLYREWFVHLRFPGHEHLPAHDGVPEGWKRVKLTSLGEIVTGKTPSTKNPDNYGNAVPFIKTPDMHNTPLVVFPGEYLSLQGADSQRNKYLPPGSVMVSCIGTVGAVAMNSSLAQTNQQINSIVPSSKNLQFYTYFAAINLKPLLEAMGGGATMTNVSKGKFESMEILLPNAQLLDKFDAFCGPTFSLVENLLLQNHHLAKARDLLLPRLMNGDSPV